ncbi:MAG: carotenoid biosynthesis protein [Bacteroidales bacterium]
MIRVEITKRKKVRYSILAAITLCIYVMGVITIADTEQREFALSVTPFALILSITALLFFREKRYTTRTLVVYSSIVLISWALEAIGVNSGIIFGEYEYGNSLGVSIIGTPILIGFNWLFLVVISQSITYSLKLKGAIAIISSSLLMVYYDTLLEEVAPLMDMWRFSLPVVPINNYIGWFVISLILNTISYKLDREEGNFMALPLLILQILLFISIIFIL